MTIFAKLSAPFPSDRVSWRVGPTNRDKTKGMALAYIDARDVMERLDAVCGPENWQNDYPHANGKTVCRIGIRIQPSVHLDARGNDELVWDGWVWKADGAGDTDMEASKGALSDAFKRAAVRWGIGRYLYDIPSPWVEIEQHGKSYTIKESEFTKLRRLLDANAGVVPAAVANGKPSPGPVATANPHSAKIAATLIAALKEAKTKEELGEWYHLESTQKAKSGLSSVDYQDVANAYRDHMRTLVAQTSVLTAG